MLKGFGGLVDASFSVVNEVISSSESSTHNAASYIHRPREKGMPRQAPGHPPFPQHLHWFSLLLLPSFPSSSSLVSVYKSFGPRLRKTEEEDHINLGVGFDDSCSRIGLKQFREEL
jgi:hypothetical protein